MKWVLMLLVGCLLAFGLTGSGARALSEAARTGADCVKQLARHAQDFLTVAHEEEHHERQR